MSQPESLLCPLIDSREQRPLELPGAVVTKLDEADYCCCEADRGSVGIERKTVADMWGSLGYGRERFLRELDRLRPYTHKALLIEGTLAEVFDGPPQASKMHPNSVIGSLAALMWRYSLPVIFAGRERAKTVLFLSRLLALAHKDVTALKLEMVELMRTFESLPDPSSLTTPRAVADALKQAVTLMIDLPATTELRPWQHYLDACNRRLDAVKVEEPCSS